MYIKSYNNECKCHHQYKYSKPIIPFKGFKTQQLDEFTRDTAASLEKSIQDSYKKFQEENEQIITETLTPEVVEIAKKIIDLPTYSIRQLPHIIGKKRADLQYLYELIKERDISSELCITGEDFHDFSELPVERLKILNPLLTLKNDMGLWSYSPSYIRYLNDNCSNEQIEIMSELAKYKVNSDNIPTIAKHPYLNHWSIIDKAKRINELFGENLREIAFLTTSKGENYISIDVGLEHKDTVPDYMNFKRLYARVGENEAPAIKRHSVSEIDKYVHNLYSKMEKKLVVFDSDKLDYAINEVMKNVPDARESEVLIVMQKLTQFANYYSLKLIENELAKAKIGRISPNNGLNYIFNYFVKNKSIIKLPALKGERYEGLLITKEDLNDPIIIKKINELKIFDDIKFINLEGWSDGVNLLSDDNLLAQKTTKVLQEVKKVMIEHPEYTFYEALDKYLNSNIENYLEENGIKYLTVKTDIPPTRRNILEQMHPIMPSESLLKSTIESIANYYTKNKKTFTDLAIRIAKYYDENIEIYSKQRMIENIKNLKLQIENFTEQNHINKENIYIIIPVKKNEIKSFEIIGEMFAKIMNIPRERVLHMSHCNQLERLPKNSVCVIADDIAASGFSLGGALEYSKLGDELSLDKHILFCPIYSTTSAIDYISTVILNMGRQSLDDVLYVKDSIKSYDSIAEKFIGQHNTQFYKNVLGCVEGEFSSYGMCISFPYMAPDNNSVLSGFLLKHFTLSENCIKSKNININSIERDTYYYDIFGTSAKNIPTRLDFHKPLYKKLNDLICDLFQRNKQ